MVNRLELKAMGHYFLEAQAHGESLQGSSVFVNHFDKSLRDKLAPSTRAVSYVCPPLSGASGGGVPMLVLIRKTDCKLRRSQCEFDFMKVASSPGLKNELDLCRLEWKVREGPLMDDLHDVRVRITEHFRNLAEGSWSIRKLGTKAHQPA